MTASWPTTPNWGSGGTCRTQATFQALGFYWCNVTAADAGFFSRITLGPPYPTSNIPARSDYPVCRT